MKKATLILTVFIAVLSYSGIYAAHDYRQALYLATYFYGAQRCGTTQSWIHGACHVKDGYATNGDLDGGWHDCGDHVLFGQTAHYAASVLLHSYVEFGSSHEDRYSSAYSAPPSNGIPDVLDEAKIMTDWMIKAHTGSGFYYQKGNGDYDHKHMCEPVYYSNTYNVTDGGEKDGRRPVSFASSGASNIAGNAAAALALMAIAYQPYDSAYATTCYNKAKAYLATGETSPSAVGGGGYYPAGNWGDDMAWGAICIRKAALARGLTSEATTYLTKAQNFTSQGGYVMPTNWIFCYDHTEPIVAYELYKAGDTSQLTKLKTEVDSYKASMVTCGTGSYAFKTEWGSLRYASNMAYIAALYSRIATGTEQTSAVTFLKNNVDFILGTHGDITGSPGAPAGRSFLIGYTNPDNTAAGSVQHPHHRAAFGRTSDADTKWVQENSNPGSVPYLYQLKGALVGGPRSSCGNYNDKIDDYVANEVGVDYNAGFVGAVAAYIYISNPPTPTMTQTFTRTNTPNPLWTATYTYTATHTPTNTPIPPPTHKLNLQVQLSNGNGSCASNGIAWNVRITNYDTVAIPVASLTIRVWLNTTKTVTVEKYDGRVYNSSGVDQGQLNTVSSAETSISQVTYDGRKANKYVTVSFSGAPDIPAGGGYLYMQGIVRNTDWSSPFDAECDDYTQMPATYTSYTNDSHYTLYEGTNLVCEYVNSTTQDTNTGINPMTGGTGCPGASTPTFTYTSTRTNTPAPTNTNTNTPTATYTYTRTNTATFTNTAIPPTSTNTNTFTYTATATGTNTGTYTATRTNTPVNTPTNTGTATYTFTGTSTNTHTNTPVPNTPTNTSTPSYTRTNTGTATATSTYTNTPTNTPVPPTSTYTNTSTETFTRTFTSTRTFTNTPTETFTRTFTNTATETYTPSETVTPGGPTLTFTHTFTNTHTFTVTHTETNTPTDTPTETYTETETETPTFTNTATDTATSTYTATNTQTATYTQTRTFTNTQTYTPTETHTNTYTFTSTNTLPPGSNTYTFTATNTASRTYTATFTNTPSITETYTFTAVYSATHTYSNTSTPVPPTFTYTQTLAPQTATPTPSATQATLIADMSFPYPNPFNPDKESELKIAVKIKPGITFVTLKVYTSAYRLILAKKYEGTALANILSAGYLSCPSNEFKSFANGTYYYTVQFGDSRKTETLKADKIIIIKSR